MKRLALLFALSMLASLSAFADGSGGSSCRLVLLPNPCGGGYAFRYCCENGSGDYVCGPVTCAIVQEKPAGQDPGTQDDQDQTEALLKAALSN